MTDHFPAVNIINGIPRVSSLDIADHFEKPHRTVLASIRKIAAECTPKFNEQNFLLVEYSDAKGESRPMYSLTRDAFSLIAMGFTGKKALTWKLRYIEAFNGMEKAILAAAQKAIEAKSKPAPKPKKLPPAPQPTYAEKTAPILERLHALHGPLHRLTLDLQESFRHPFWPVQDAQANKKAFAESMNYGIQSLAMALNKDFEAIMQFYTAYIEGERILKA